MGIFRKKSKDPPPPSETEEITILKRVSETAIDNANQRAEAISKEWHEKEMDYKKKITEMRQAQALQMAGEQKLREEFEELENEKAKEKEDFEKQLKALGKEIQQLHRDLQTQKEEANKELVSVNKRLQLNNAALEMSEETVRWQDEKLRQFNADKAFRDGIEYAERGTQVLLPKSLWQASVGVQAVETMSTQSSQTFAEAPRARIHTSILTKGCQTLLGRKHVPRDQNTQTDSHANERRQQPRWTLASDIGANCGTHFLDMSRSIRRMLAKDSHKAAYEIPHWLRGEHDMEMETLRRVLG